MPDASIMPQLVVASVALLFVHIAAQAITVTREFGSRWNAGPRDEGLRPEGKLAGRAERALRNYLETFPAFGLLALALIVTGRADGAGMTGAWLWLAARIVYLPLYIAGVPYLRSLVWTVAAVGLTMMVWRLLA